MHEYTSDTYSKVKLVHIPVYDGSRYNVEFETSDKTRFNQLDSALDHQESLDYDFCEYDFNNHTVQNVIEILKTHELDDVIISKNAITIRISRN